MDFLIKSGADCNQSIYLDKTPFYAASRTGHADVVDLLIKCGADCNQQNNLDETLLYAFSSAGHADVVDLLIKSSADCNQSDIFIFFLYLDFHIFNIFQQRIYTY